MASNAIRWTPEQLAAFESKRAAMAVYRSDRAAGAAEKLAKRCADPDINDKLSETAIQKAFIVWAHAEEARDWRMRLLFAVPNGGKRDERTAVTMLREGLRPGVCDVMLPCRGGPHNGLAIEFKAKRGVLSGPQKTYIADLERAGWKVEVCRSTIAAIDLVNDYLALTPQISQGESEICL